MKRDVGADVLVDASVHPFRKETAEVSAKEIIDGTLLYNQSKQHVRDFGKTQGDWCAPEQLSIGTLCSGTEVVSLAVHALSVAMKEADYETELEVKFACESSPDKQRWVGSVFDVTWGEGPCIFRDINDMTSIDAHCVRHSRKCRIPRVNGVIAGTSCKDLSRANTRQHSDVLSPQASGTSANTLSGLLGYLSVHCPDWCILENVDELVSESENLNLLCAHAAARGYDMQGYILDSLQYGLPQSRRRLYVVFARTSPRTMQITGGFDAFFKRVNNILVCAQRLPPCITGCLLPGDDPRLQRALAERAKEAPEVFTSNTIQADG